MPSDIFGDHPEEKLPGTKDKDSRVGLKPHSLYKDKSGKPAYPANMVERRNEVNRNMAERAKGKILDKAEGAVAEKLFTKDRSGQNMLYGRRANPRGGSNS